MWQRTNLRKINHRKVAFFLSLLFIGLNSFGQAENTLSIPMGGLKDARITVRWEVLETKENQRAIELKFKNKTGEKLLADIRFGFYYNGVLEEEMNLNVCLKKSLFGKLTQPSHLIESKLPEESGFDAKQLEIKILNHEIKKTDECPEQAE